MPAEACSAVKRSRVAAALEVILCSGLPTQLALTAWLTAAGLEPVDPAGRLSLPFVALLSLGDALLVLGLIVVFLAAGGERPRTVFLDARPAAREALLGLWLTPMAYTLALLVLGVVRLAAPWLRDVPVNPFESLLATPGGRALVAVLVVVAGGIREELQRAFILHRFDQALGGVWIGLVLFSAVFGLGHLQQGRDVAIATACLGLFWGAVYLKRRSVIAPIVSHAAFNLAEVLRHSL